jgi:hypothetical protein
MSLGIGTEHSGSLRIGYGIQAYIKLVKAEHRNLDLSPRRPHTIQAAACPQTRTSSQQLVLKTQNARGTKNVGKPAVSRCYAVATGNEGNLIRVASFKSRRWCSKEKPISSLARQLCWHTTDLVTI